jgi:hypothetical protein
MKCFPKSNENDFHMYAKLQDLMFHECLELNSLRFDLYEFSTRQ